MRTFTIKFRGGWGARFAMLGAALLFANKHGRRLRVCWDYLFPCPWQAFTSTKIDIVPVAEWEGLKEKVPEFSRKKFAGGWTDENGQAADSDLVVAADYSPNSLGVSFSAALDAVRGFVDFSACEARADVLAREIGFERRMCGVHVRRTDHIAAWARSSTDGFVQEMRSRDSTQFFVCSDSDQERDRLLQRFSGVCARTIVKRESREDLLQALSELILLSRCTEIIGSFDSNFSVAASLYGSIPLTVVDDF